MAEKFRPRLRWRYKIKMHFSSGTTITFDAWEFKCTFKNIEATTLRLKSYEYDFCNRSKRPLGFSMRDVVAVECVSKRIGLRWRTEK